MNMKTELILQETKILGGEKIEASVYPTPSLALHASMGVLSNLLFWLFECQSNSTMRSIHPLDSIETNLAWVAYKKVLKKFHKASGSANPGLRMTHKLALPTPAMMRRYRNRKIQGLAFQIFNHIHVNMSLDISRGRQLYNLVDYKTIEKSQEITEDFISLYIGTGLPIEGKEGEWDTGMDMPAFIELGELSPDNDLDVMTFEEPSVLASDAGLGDVPDTDPVRKSIVINPAPEQPQV